MNTFFRIKKLRYSIAIIEIQVVFMDEKAVSGEGDPVEIPRPGRYFFYHPDGPIKK